MVNVKTVVVGVKCILQNKKAMNGFAKGYADLVIMF